MIAGPIARPPAKLAPTAATAAATPTNPTVSWNDPVSTQAMPTDSFPSALPTIVVMSPRPGRVTDVIESPLPAERPLDIRESKEFLEVAHRVREGLREGHSYDE